MITPKEAIRLVDERFPFQGYFNPARGSYINIAQTTLRYLSPPAKILDVGAGPCDKTAVLAALGFRCSACDDLNDYWHGLPGNREKILRFATSFGVSFHIIDETTPLPYERDEFDMVMMHDVLEHLHNSPREILNTFLEFVKPNGFLFITVPNAANLAKRVRLAFGHTNLPPFESYYWYPDPWRGHVREYVRNDLIRLAGYLNLKPIEIRGCHNNVNTLSPILRPIWIALTAVVSGGRDNWVLVAQKGPGWLPRKSLPQREMERIMERYSFFGFGG